MEKSGYPFALRQQSDLEASARAIEKTAHVVDTTKVYGSGLAVAGLGGATVVLGGAALNVAVSSGVAATVATATMVTAPMVAAGIYVGYLGVDLATGGKLPGGIPEFHLRSGDSDAY